jgi:hypothetical protein
VVIPIFDLSGQVAQMYGRKITPNLRVGTPDHLYLPGPHRGVWNETALAVSKDVILCEALIDALTFWCAGYRNVTAIYGVNGFTEEHRAVFRKHGTKRIFIAYDRDEAGEGAAQEHAAQLMEMGIECFRVQFPKSMDANEYALKVQPASKSLGIMLNRAAWLGKGERPAVTLIDPVKIEPVKIEPPPPEPAPQIEFRQRHPVPWMRAVALANPTCVPARYPNPLCDSRSRGLRKGWLNVRRKHLFGEPCRLIRGIPSGPRLRVLTSCCRCFGDGFRGTSGNTSRSCGFHEALGRDVNVTFGAVYRVTSNRFATTTANPLRFRNFDQWNITAFYFALVLLRKASRYPLPSNR